MPWARGGRDTYEGPTTHSQTDGAGRIVGEELRDGAIYLENGIGSMLDRAGVWVGVSDYLDTTSVGLPRTQWVWLPIDTALTLARDIHERALDQARIAGAIE